MLFFAFGLLLLALFYQNRLSKMKRHEAELMLKASLESEKKERQRIAADLHDGVSGDLNAIRNFLSILLKGEENTERQELFEEIKKGVEAAIENTRIASYKLMPPLLESYGFLVAVEDYFENLKTKTGINFEIISNKKDLDFSSSSVSYELFRVLQEFTTNMIKYGSISICKVIVNVEKENVTLEIIDDGNVYNFKQLSTEAKGTGVKNIVSRLKIIDAKLTQQDADSGNNFIITLKK